MCNRGLTERRAFAVMRMSASSLRYQGAPDGNVELRERIVGECLNEHWFMSLPHARTLIEAWRREYNEKDRRRLWAG